MISLESGCLVPIVKRHCLWGPHAYDRGVVVCSLTVSFEIPDRLNFVGEEVENPVGVGVNIDEEIGSIE